MPARMLNLFLRIFLAFSMFLLTYLSSSKSHDPTAEKQSPAKSPNNKGKKHIVLLGASIGRAWNISSLPERIGSKDYVFEYVESGGFDKSNKLREILTPGENKPDAIILKECAAYFPGDFGYYNGLMEQWIRDCYQAGVVSIPATVVPVTRLHSIKKFAIDIAKLRNPFKQGTPFRNKRQKAILEYNDWLRTYCTEKGLTILDLEKAVRVSEKSRYLRSSLAKVDGLHLNNAGYQNIDQIVRPTLEKVNWDKKIQKNVS
jgi:hypothetical protein